MFGDHGDHDEMKFWHENAGGRCKGFRTIAQLELLMCLLLAKVLPLQVTGDAGGDFKTISRVEIVPVRAKDTKLVGDRKRIERDKKTERNTKFEDCGA